MNKNYLLMCLLLIGTLKGVAQTSNRHGNEWIKYDKTYVRIGVVVKGVQKINVSDLPSYFSQVNPETYQLWHRGKEVPLISASSSELFFYGEPNDGASDTLLYRPSNARLNANVSLFSDEGSYFLTVSNDAKRVPLVEGSVLKDSEILEYHFQKEVKIFTNQFAFSTFGIDELLNNSFYEASNSYTSSTIWGPKVTSQYSSGLSYLDANLALKNFYKGTRQNPELEILVNGLNTGPHNVEIYCGKDTSSTSLIRYGVLPFVGYDGKKIKLTLDKEKSFGANNLGVLRVRTNTDSNKDWFGLSYFTLEYPQLADMDGMGSSYFNYKAGSTTRRIKVLNVPEDFQLFDISDMYKPILIQGRRLGSTLEAMVESRDGGELRLLINQKGKVMVIPAARIYPTDFNPMYASPLLSEGKPKGPNSYDFLIISSDKLKTSSIEYAKYRSSSSGGGKRTIAVDIRKIYDEFNYGEPSPVAIRKFVAYMLSAGVREKEHNLLLIGHSVTWPTRLVKEMPGEVPTFGDPGSDMLLVSGLFGRDIDIPLIPVGRINAFSNQEVLNYLNKVDTYEHEGETSWRRNILHLNGGHSVSEINQLKTLLSNLVPEVENGVLKGKVFPFVKKQGISETEKVNISAEVNAGAGMITYFGHGSQSITDLDMGYVSDVTRGYTNSRKYPLMFFNGCGVGNIFASRLNHTLSSDWLLTPNKGAIAVVSNSYMSYVSPSSKHLQELYKQVFLNEVDHSIGQILLNVSKKILASNTSTYDIANLHQSYIQGDPSIVALRPKKPDLGIVAEGSIRLHAEKPTSTIGSSKLLTTSAVISNEGRIDKNQSVTIGFSYFYDDGSVKRFDQEFVLEQLTDTIYHEFEPNGRLSRIEVLIDPETNLLELSRDNNEAWLDVDWDDAKTKSIYLANLSKDIVPPVLSVYYDNRMLANFESIVGGKNFKFVVRDDRYLAADSENITVYLRNCAKEENCEYIEIASSQLVFSKISNREFAVIYSRDTLLEGKYELLVRTRDSAGNSSANPYLVSFEVKIGINGNAATIRSFPNPASDFVKFHIDYEEEFKECYLTIFNSLGVEVKELLFGNTNNSTSEIYWKPEVSSGVYSYKFKGVTRANNLVERSGKIVIVR